MPRNIKVEGLPYLVQIEGDEPNELEMKAITQALGQETLRKVDIEQGQPKQQQIPQKPSGPREGPLGVMPARPRTAIREFIEETPWYMRLGIESAPAVSGTIAGFNLGLQAAPFAGPFAPLVPVASAALGGLTGELFGQETGLAPKSRTNQIIAAAAPPVAKGIGEGVRLIRRGTGLAVTNLPPVKSAMGRQAEKRGFQELESAGTNILARQQGLMARSASELYGAVRRAGITFSGQSLVGTRTAISELLTEMKATSAFPEVRQAMQVLKNLNSTLGQNEVTVDTVVRARSILGAAVNRARAGGVKLGSAKKAFSALASDLDNMAEGNLLMRGPNGQFSARQAPARIARVAQAAVQRAKLEFAVKDMEGMLAKSIKPVPGEQGVYSLYPKKFLNELTAITNPRHPRFDKNFTNAMAEHLPQIKSRLSELAKLSEAGSPGGAGSIVVRGMGARAGRSVLGAITGGIVGAGTAGPVGAAAGGLLGASFPEQLAAILSNDKAFRFLERVGKLGKGEIHNRAWTIALQIVMRDLAGQENE